jgi:DNA-binding transcriptional regulator YdaS (Cro superfamily)
MHRACQELGGVDALANYLGVHVSQLTDWLRGVREPPENYFLQAVGVIVGHRESV